MAKGFAVKMTFEIPPAPLFWVPVVLLVPVLVRRFPVVVVNVNLFQLLFALVTSLSVEHKVD